MSDQGAQDPPGLTPEEEAELTAWLRRAHAPEPVPEEVVGRLDRALADLVAARSDAADAAGPADPADPAGPGKLTTGDRTGTRARRVPALLLAAAAVVVAGFGVDAVLGGSGGFGGSGDSAGSAALDTSGAGRAESGGAGGDAEPGPRARTRVESGAGPAAKGPVGLVTDPPAVIRSRSLRTDTVHAVARFDRARSAYVAAVGASSSPGAGPHVTAGRCRPPRPTPAAWFVVEFDGSTASLSTVPSDPSRADGPAATVQVRIRSCTGDLLAATTVPAP